MTEKEILYKAVGKVLYDYLIEHTKTEQYNLELLLDTDVDFTLSLPEELSHYKGRIHGVNFSKKARKIEKLLNTSYFDSSQVTSQLCECVVFLIDATLLSNKSRPINKLLNNYYVATNTEGVKYVFLDSMFIGHRDGALNNVGVSVTVAASNGCIEDRGFNIIKDNIVAFEYSLNRNSDDFSYFLTLKSLKDLTFYVHQNYFNSIDGHSTDLLKLKVRGVQMNFKFKLDTNTTVTLLRGAISEPALQLESIARMYYLSNTVYGDNLLESFYFYCTELVGFKVLRERLESFITEKRIRDIFCEMNNLSV